MTINVGILALDGCLGLSVFGPVDLFNTANMIVEQSGRGAARFDARIMAIGAGPVTTSGGEQLVVEATPSDESWFDVIILPGIGARSSEELENILAGHDGVAEMLVRLAQGRAIIAAACTGTFILAKSGLLHGRRATTTWWMADQFRREFPDVTLEEDELLVDDGNLISSAAGASSLDLSLHIIKRLAGPSLARLTARYLVVDGGRKSQNSYAVPWHARNRDPLVEKADAWIRAQHGERPSVSDLAGHLSLSERSLLRKFRKLTGITPQAYIRSVRLDQSKQDLEASRLSIAQIAADAGFSDENAFRKAFVQRTGITPSQYRKQFRSGGRNIRRANRPSAD